MGYSPWNCKVLDMTEYANGFFIIFTVHVIFFFFLKHFKGPFKGNKWEGLVCFSVNTGSNTILAYSWGNYHDQVRSFL